MFLSSFVSKYLHFHCPIVPIFDSNAQAAIGQFVDWDTVTSIREAMPDLPEWARAYRDFVAACVVLYRRAYAKTTLEPTVKELDHLLWHAERPPGGVNAYEGLSAYPIHDVSGVVMVRLIIQWPAVLVAKRATVNKNGSYECGRSGKVKHG